MTQAAEARTIPLTDEIRALINTFTALASVYLTASLPPDFDTDSYYAGFRAGSRSAYADVVLRLQTLAEFGGGE